MNNGNSNDIPGKEAKAPAAKKPVPKKAAADKSAASAPAKKAAPKARVAKAQKAQKRVVKGTHGTRVKKVRTSVQFHRPKTFRPARQPKYPRKAIPRRNRSGQLRVLSWELLL